MVLSRLIRILVPGSFRSAACGRGRRNRCRLELECLESRLTPAFVGTPNQNFVSLEYLDLLNRQVDPTGFVGWTNLLNQGLSRFQEVQEVQGSLEYRRNEVNFLYEHFLGRLPDSAGGLLFLLNGGSFETLEASIVGSPEYFQKSGGTISGFLNAAYRDLLNRTPDAQGLAGWTLVLSQGTSRSLFASLVIGGPEYAEIQVNQDYMVNPAIGTFQSFQIIDAGQYLHRPAGTAEVSFWAPVQQQNGQDFVIAAFVSSLEYFHTAQVFPQTPIPTVGSVMPTSGAVGTTVIFGGGFLLNATVTFNGTPASVTVLPGGNFVMTTVPVGATDGPVTLTTPFSAMFGGPFSTPFIVLPRITSFRPTSGAVLSQVTIFGNNFTGATSVTINGTADPSGGLIMGGFDVNSDTQITATVPNGVNVSAGPITVTTPDGTAISSNTFTVTAPGSPTISMINPDNVTSAGGVGGSVTITGTNFIKGQMKVAFPGLAAQSVPDTSINATGTSMTVVIPAGAATTGPITVSNNTGSAPTPAFFFVPTLGAGNPNPAIFGNTITFTGTNLNFIPTTAITVDGTTPAGLTINAAGTSLSFTVPSVAGSHTLRVTNSAGTASATFTANPPAPTITNILSENVENMFVRIMGTNFFSPSVTFKGTPIPISSFTTTEIDVLMSSLCPVLSNADITNGVSLAVVVTTASPTPAIGTFVLTADADAGDNNGGADSDDFC